MIDTDSLWTYSHLSVTFLTMPSRNKGANRFGAAVRRARTAAGFTQEDLADRSGLDRSYIGGIERGERNPTLTVIEKIASGLGLSVAELFSIESAQEPEA